MSAETAHVWLVTLTLIVVVQFALLVGIAVAVSAARVPGTPLQSALLRGGAAVGGTLTLGLLCVATIKDLLG